jgi:hypothetical protein
LAYLQEECQLLALAEHSEMKLVVNRICEGLGKGVWMKSWKRRTQARASPAGGNAGPRVSDSMAVHCGHTVRMLTGMVIVWRMGVCPSHPGSALELTALERYCRPSLDDGMSSPYGTSIANVMHAQLFCPNQILVEIWGW